MNTEMEEKLYEKWKELWNAKKTDLCFSTWLKRYREVKNTNGNKNRKSIIRKKR